MPRLSSSRLSLPLVRSLQPGDEIADSDVRGLTARASAAGTVSYSLRYRTPAGQRRVTLGTHPAITPDAARQLARDLLARVARGEDPSADRAAARMEPTLGEIFDMFMSAHGPRLTESTRANYARAFRLHVAPALGGRKVSSITRADVSTLHATMKAKGLYLANQVLRILGSLFSWAVESSILSMNPAEGVRKYKEEGRERFLSPDERARLWSYLDAVESGDGYAPEGGQRFGLAAVKVIRLCLLTGARKSEILALRWSDLDLDRALWRLPESKTGKSDRPLLPQCVAYLRQLAAGRESLSPLVCPSRSGREVTSVDETWQRIRAAVGLSDVRLHDLRHSLASDGLAAGLPLAVIGRLLGHRNVQSTARYAHLADDVAMEAARVVGERLAAIHGATPDAPATVLPLRRR